MKVRARNQLKGTVKMAKKIPDNTEVTVTLPGGAEIVLGITRWSAENMRPKEEMPVYAVVKATEVMIGID